MSIKFYQVKGKYGCFSNFSKHEVVYNNTTFPTSEHFFQAMKFVDNDLKPFSDEHEILFNRIREASNPTLAKKLGRSRSVSIRPDWEKEKFNIMCVILIHKFNQHEDCLEILLDTGDLELIEHSSNDSVWADGGDGSGLNLLGKALMVARKYLRENETVR